MKQPKQQLRNTVEQAEANYMMGYCDKKAKIEHAC
jgi:hypothetical protein